MSPARPAHLHGFLLAALAGLAIAGYLLGFSGGSWLLIFGGMAFEGFFWIAFAIPRWRRLEARRRRQLADSPPPSHA